MIKSGLGDQNQSTAKLIYNIVREIPEGKVMTYGKIATLVSLKLMEKVSPRYVGYVLHKNEDPEIIPCHRVVNARGKVAKSYKFGGWEAQRKKLLVEGIRFKDKEHVYNGFL